MAKSPTTTEPDSELAVLRAMVESQAKQMDEMKNLLIAKLLEQQPGQKMTANQTYMEKVYMDKLVKEEEAQKKFDKDRLWSAVESEMRTQVAANEMYKDGTRLMKISVGWCPAVVVRGHSQEECEGRYRKVCGIQWVKPDDKKPERTTYNVIDVSNDPDSLKQVGLTQEELMTATPTGPITRKVLAVA